ncbi:MAG: hypothetical protein VYE51_05630 [Candidatus Thermoplasmatota archaeon]|nr:hypothetical protein [Candidatus Thermoplasmatota archaeon]
MPPHLGGYSALSMAICMVHPKPLSWDIPLESIDDVDTEIQRIKSLYLFAGVMDEDKPDPVRFGAEFGPYRSSKTSGVSLSTFKTLVWTSNIGGLILMVIGLELMIVQHAYSWALLCFVFGVGIALFPSNYEIVGMEEDHSSRDES